MRIYKYRKIFCFSESSDGEIIKTTSIRTCPLSTMKMTTHDKKDAIGPKYAGTLLTMKMTTPIIQANLNKINILNKLNNLNIAIKNSLHQSPDFFLQEGL